MHLYLEFRKLHKERTLAPKDAVMHTICNKFNYYLARFIDWVFQIIPGIIVIYIIIVYDKISKINIYILSLIFILILGLSVIGYIYLTGILNGHTIGHRLFGLRLVRISDQKLMDREMYYTYLSGSAYQGFRYDDTYEALSTLFSDTNQSPVFKKLGYIVVKKSLYDLFIEDYMEDGKIISNIDLKTNKHLNNTSQIFFD